MQRPFRVEDERPNKQYRAGLISLQGWQITFEAKSNKDAFKKAIKELKTDEKNIWVKVKKKAK